MHQTIFPKISIVIPNFNGGKYLEETIISIIEQDYPAFEIIIVDGGSTDNSLEIIHKYEGYLTRWLSEPDSGQANAINKGLQFVTGELFDWMNSDDVIAPGTFWKVAQAFESHPDAYIVCGYMTYFEGEKYGSPVRMKIYPGFEETMIFGSMSAPSMYFKMDKLRELGPFCEPLHHCFDQELWYRFVERYGIKRLFFLDENLSYFRLHSGSKTVSQFLKFGEDSYLLHHSILSNCAHGQLPIIPAKTLGIEREYQYQRDWKFSGLNCKRFAALAMQRHLETLHARLSYLSILKWWLTSLAIAPYKRSLGFVILPLRAIRWKILVAVKFKQP